MTSSKDATPSPDFIKAFAALGEGTEIPAEFMLWCAISGISGILERRVWLDMGPFVVFPNLYVVLIAGSGRCRKSTAIKQLVRILKALDPGPNLVSQKITPEGLIDALKVEQDVAASSRGSVGFVIVDELSVFLNRKSYEGGLASLLIPLYDCDNHIEYRTKGRGIEELRGSSLSLLGASTIDWLKNAIPSDAIGGGLTSRMIFVYVSEPPAPVPWPAFGPEKQQLLESLVAFLEKVQGLEGEVTLSEEAKSYYEKRYIDFSKNSTLFDDPLLSGYASRRFVHFLKLGIIFSVSEGRTDLVIQHSHLLCAENILTMIEPGMPRVLSMVMATEKGALCDVILKKIEKHGKMKMKITVL